MANRKKRTQKLDDAFFEALSAHGFVTKACKTSGYKRSQVYVWKDEDEAFGERWDDAIAEHVEKLEAEADCQSHGLFRHAVDFPIEGFIA